MDIKDLLDLADEGKAADFMDAVAEILDQKSQETVEKIADIYQVEEFSDADEELSDEELAEICANITEEEFEDLDEESQATLIHFLMAQENADED